MISELIFMGLKEKLEWLDPFTYIDLYVLPKINPKNYQILNWAVYLISAFFFAWVIYSALGLLLGTTSPLVIVVSGSMEPVLYRGDVVILLGAKPEEINAPLVELGEPTLQGVAFEEIGSIEFNPQTGNAQKIAFKNGKSIGISTEGDTIVYFSSLRREQIIHRAVAKLKAADGYYLLTKGDNLKTNKTIDQDCGKVISYYVSGTDVPIGGFPEKGCISLYPIPAESIDGKALFKIPFIGYVKLIVFDEIPKFIASLMRG